MILGTKLDVPSHHLYLTHARGVSQCIKEGKVNKKQKDLKGKAQL
jgi:hypothetical protein